MEAVPISVMLVDDSPIALAILKRMLATTQEIKVIGTALNGKQALDMIPELQPDVICTDLHMPLMDGFQFTNEVMAKHPRPILVISSAVQEEDRDNVFRVLEAGAIEVFPKPRGGLGLKSDYHPLTNELIDKIRVLAKVNVAHKSRKTPTKTQAPSPSQNKITPNSKIEIVTIGASTGGPNALQSILCKLPANLPVPIVCVLHLSEGFLPQLMHWLKSKCALPIEVAELGQKPKPGVIYFPPDNKHLQFNEAGQFVSERRLPLMGHRPSITITFNSIADQFGSKAVGILLTGMGKDGVEGMQSIAQKGGVTIVQDEKSSVVFDMSKQAIESGASQYVLSLDEIADTLARLVMK